VLAVLSSAPHTRTVRHCHIEHWFKSDWRWLIQLWQGNNQCHNYHSQSWLTFRSSLTTKFTERIAPSDISSEISGLHFKHTICSHYTLYTKREKWLLWFELFKIYSLRGIRMTKYSQVAIVLHLVLSAAQSREIAFPRRVGSFLKFILLKHKGIPMCQNC